MLMMMRAGGITENTPSPCDTPENQLACMIGSATCPSECQNTDITTFTGTLQLEIASITV